ncbi:MAG: HU family DNA-binding protein [Candidatus Eisenbacteria bacterium]
MNKGELVAKVAQMTNLSQRQTRDVIDATFDTIKKNTKKKEGVQLAGFGSFTVSRRKARMGRNPQTGESIKISASKNVRFKAGKSYKTML